METVCQVFLFGLDRVALLIFLKKGLGSLIFREGPVQKRVSTERGEECSVICPYPRTFVPIPSHLPDSAPLPSQQRDLPQAPFPYQLVAISLGPFPWLSFPSQRTPSLVTLYICLVLSES